MELNKKMKGVYLTLLLFNFFIKDQINDLFKKYNIANRYLISSDIDKMDTFLDYCDGINDAAAMREADCSIKY